MSEIIQVHFASNTDKGLSHGLAGPSRCPTRWCLEKEIGITGDTKLCHTG